MTITEFLLARIAEDEEAARACPEFFGEFTLSGASAEAIGNHIARHDPARVLAECEAKRRIIELRYSWNLQAERAPEPPFGPILQAQVITADTVIRTLAAIYSDHEDYDPDWRA